MTDRLGISVAGNRFLSPASHASAAITSATATAASVRTAAAYVARRRAGTRPLCARSVLRINRINNERRWQKRSRRRTGGLHCRAAPGRPGTDRPTLGEVMRRMNLRHAAC